MFEEVQQTSPKRSLSFHWKIKKQGIVDNKMNNMHVEENKLELRN